MNRGITRIALVVIVVLGTFAVGAIATTADHSVQAEPLPPMDQPGPRVGFWFTAMPRLTYVDGEEFVLRFTAVPLTGAVQVWDLDISTYMTYGSRFEGGDNLGPRQRATLSTVLVSHGFVPDSSNPTETLREIWRGLSESERSELINDLKPLGFKYEPWESALEMLQGFWTESGLCDGMLGLVSGPDGSSTMLHHPCLAPRPSIEALVEHGPTGWYEFTQALTRTLHIAIPYAERGYPVEIFVANRGPVMDEDRDLIPEIIDLATAYGIRINVMPMGNEPGSRMRFPYLKPLRELAEATGGSIYYQPNLQNIYDFSMLSRMVPQMMRDFYGRVSQIDSGTLVAPRASLVLAPSEHVQVLSPAASDVATGAGVRVNFQGLTIGAPQSVDLRLRVSTNITETLLPVFRGSTGWTDFHTSYFEWIDPTGHPHRLPIPQRLISVTMGAVDTAIATPTPTATRPRVPSPTSSPMPTESPTPTHTATSSPVPTATPSATATTTSRPTASSTLTATPSPTASSTLTATPLPTASSTATTTPRPTASSTLTATPSPTASSTLKATPSPTASPTLTATPSPTASSTATTTPRPTASSTTTATPPPTASSTATATPLATPSATATTTPLPTASSTLTATPPPTASSTLTATPSATATTTPLPTASSTLTATPLPTASSTVTATPLATPSATATTTPLPTASATLTATPRPTASITPTATPSATATATATFTATRSPTPSFTATATRTATPTATPEPTMTPVTRMYNAYIALIARGHRSQAYRPYPAPRAIARVEIPVLDTLLRRFAP